MGKRWAVLVLLSLAGCEKAVLDHERDIGRVEMNRACQKVGYCYTAMPGFDGKVHASFKLSAFCPGTRSAIVEAVERTYHYPSKPEKRLISIVPVREISSGPCT